MVSASVGGFITSANERARSAQVAAVQTAIDTFASTHLDASGDLTLATYPYSTTSTTGGATSCCVTFDGVGHSNGVSIAPGAGSAPLERYQGYWYGGDGRFCQTTGANCTALPGSGSTEFYVYVDLYSGSNTDLNALGFIRLSPASSPGSVTTRTAGVPGTSSATAFRCLFQSNEDGISSSATIAAAKSAVRANKGKLYACRDADPAGT